MRLVINKESLYSDQILQPPQLVQRRMCIVNAECAMFSTLHFTPLTFIHTKQKTLIFITVLV